MKESSKVIYLYEREVIQDEELDTTVTPDLLKWPKWQQDVAKSLGYSSRLFANIEE